MLQRIGLFLLTNIAVIVLLNVVLMILEKVFGIQATGMTYFIVIAAVIGFGGAIISLFLSKWSAKRAYKLTMVTLENVSQLSDKERVLFDTVSDLAERNHIKTPEMGIYTSDIPNAFATGATKNSSLVAVSTGLLNLMTKDELEWVIAHEMAHILNGDMVTMTLLQWIINTFIVFASRMIANIVSQFVDENFSWIVYFITSIILDIIFGLLASPIVMWFSRYREYKADAGSARYVGKEKMIAALRALEKIQGVWKSNPQYATMHISSPKESSWKALFSSHPTLEKRIIALDNLII